MVTIYIVKRRKEATSDTIVGVFSEWVKANSYMDKIHEGYSEEHWIENWLVDFLI
ncbi:hypothetical protein D3C73_492140 [compost metagenome]